MKGFRIVLIALITAAFAFTAVACDDKQAAPTEEPPTEAPSEPTEAPPAEEPPAEPAEEAPPAEPAEGEGE